MRITLLDVKLSDIPKSVGIAACDSRFIDLVNQAQERLADMGRWWGTYAQIQICVTANCIVWPSFVKTVESFNLCSRNVPVQNTWFEFQRFVPAPSADCCGSNNLLERGTMPHYRVFDRLSRIRLYPSQASDYGKRVLVQGYDGNGHPIRSEDTTTGQYVDGEFVVLANPFGQSGSEFKNPVLTGIQKPVTNGRVTATAYGSSIEKQIAIWGPNETRPAYRRTYLLSKPNPCATGTACEPNPNDCKPDDPTCSDTLADALVRMELVPAVSDQDWLLIQSKVAIKHMMKAIQKEDRNQYSESEREIQLALRALRNQLESYSPRERTTINLQTQGSAKLNRVLGGMI